MGSESRPPAHGLHLFRPFSGSYIVYGLKWSIIDTLSCSRLLHTISQRQKMIHEIHTSLT